MAVLCPETVKSVEGPLSAGERPKRLTLGTAPVSWSSIWEGMRFES